MEKENLGSEVEFLLTFDLVCVDFFVDLSLIYAEMYFFFLFPFVVCHYAGHVQLNLVFWLCYFACFI